MNYLGLYLEFIKIRLQSMIEYRSAFLSGALAQAASYSAELLLVWIMINQFETIGTWGPYEVMFLYALNLLTYAVAGFFLYNPHASLSGMIRTGEFDEVLTKPLNPLLYIVCRMFNYGYFSHTAISIIIIGICFVKLGISITLIKVLFLVVIVISGALIQGAIFLFASVPSFWLVENSGFRVLFWNSKEFIKYPISIYNKAIQLFLTLIMPYAFISFYPAQYFLNKDDFLMFHPVLQYTSPIVGIIVFTIAYKFWTLGIKNYTSTGS